MAYQGNIRHILTSDDVNDTTAWEISMAAKNTYQNGAYWGMPTGWVCYAVAMANTGAAEKLAAEYIENLRKTDFRKGGDYGGPYECFYPPDYKQNPVYLTSSASAYELTPMVKQLMGSFKVSKPINYKKILRDEKLKNWGRRLQ